MGQKVLRGAEGSEEGRGEAEGERVGEKILSSAIRKGKKVVFGS